MRKMYLPNTEFIFNLGDWPLVKTGSYPVPIISWCGSRGGLLMFNQNNSKYRGFDTLNGMNNAYDMVRGMSDQTSRKFFH